MRVLLSTQKTVDLGLLFLRIGVGFIFIKHGSEKILSIETWHWLGSQMANLGITFMPPLWGFIAAYTEFIGGICLVLGLGTRIVSLLLSCVMFVAFMHHYAKGDSWGHYSSPLSFLAVFLGIALTGPGRYSLDHYLFERGR